MEKIQGSFEVVFSDNEKTNVNYSREELSMPTAYDGNVPMTDASGNPAGNINFNLFDASRKFNLNLNNVSMDDATLFDTVKSKMAAVMSAVAEEKVNIQAKIDSLNVYYQTQTPAV